MADGCLAAGNWGEETLRGFSHPPQPEVLRLDAVSTTYKAHLKRRLMWFGDGAFLLLWIIVCQSILRPDQS
jgi:hypothetical protein